jgi:Tol biopolymer transport system component
MSDRDGSPEIYRIRSDGTGLTRLTRNAAEDWFPSWAPDGTRIAFSSNRDGNHEVYLMNPDGGEVQRLTDNGAEDWGPTWWPGTG